MSDAADADENAIDDLLAMRNELVQGRREVVRTFVIGEGKFEKARLATEFQTWIEAVDRALEEERGNQANTKRNGQN